MLNAKRQRELAYIVQINSVEPIEGYDRIAYATVGGWHCVVGKDMKAGDKAVYFEIDSLLPSEDERFAFTEKYGYKVKTQKYCKGSKISQGLLMPLTEFPELSDLSVGDFVTEILKVTYYDPMDRARKAHVQTRETLPVFKVLKRHFPCKQLMRTKLGKKILLSIFGVRKKTVAWPDFVPKTDEERVQNVPFRLQDKTPIEATEKIDGTSTTFAIRRRPNGKPQIWVCSRNVVLTRKKKAYYDQNYWFEMYDKYHIEHVLTDLLEDFQAEWVYIQGETYGDGVQKRDYSLKNERRFAAFNLCFSNSKRLSYADTRRILTRYGVPTVPIIFTEYVLPDTVDELVKMAHGGSRIDNLPREGLVFRHTVDTGISFKAVDPEFLVKYHN